ncbi:hypothetical protein DFJ73DRAFT_881388 [Zopfochytrium polystomum]|nr:hypothetical protein DFJ73DRAFT_881388 [Zopfochytrium polystomum]
MSSTTSNLASVYAASSYYGGSGGPPASASLQSAPHLLYQQQQQQQQQLQLQNRGGAIPFSAGLSAPAFPARGGSLAGPNGGPQPFLLNPFEEVVSERPPPFGCAWGPSLGLPPDATRPSDNRLFGGPDPPHFHIPQTRPVGFFSASELANGPFPLGEPDNQWRLVHDALRARKDYAGVRDLRGVIKRFYAGERPDLDRPPASASWRGPQALPPSHQGMLDAGI